MSVSLDHEAIKAALTLIHKAPEDPAALERFLATVAPIIRVTQEKFSYHLSDDIGQEVRILLMKKAPFLAKEYFAGQIDNVTNYLFTVAYNAALAYTKKELKHDDRLVSIDDVKVEPVLNPKSQRKQEILQLIKEQTLEWVRLRFPKKSDARKAEKFVHAIFEGKRPSFKAQKLEAWAHQRAASAKDTYSIVHDKIRELTLAHMEELSE